MSEDFKKHKENMALIKKDLDDKVDKIVKDVRESRPKREEFRKKFNLV